MPLQIINVVFNLILFIFCVSLLVYLLLNELQWTVIMPLGCALIVIGWTAYELWDSYYHAVNRKVVITEDGVRYINKIKYNTSLQEKHGIDLLADEFVRWDEITLIECTKKISKLHKGFDYYPDTVITLHTPDKDIEIPEYVFDLQSQKRVYQALIERAKTRNIPYFSEVREIE